VKGTHLVIYLLVYFEFILLCFVAYEKKMMLNIFIRRATIEKVKFINVSFICSS